VTVKREKRKGKGRNGRSSGCRANTEHAPDRAPEVRCQDAGRAVEEVEGRG